MGEVAGVRGNTPHHSKVPELGEALPSLRDAALAYARSGFHVFPLKPGGKEPLLKWRDESTTDAATIAAWWSDGGASNVGIDCGKSGLAVIDIDRPGAEKELDLPPTLTASTGKGLHLFYRGTLSNSAGRLAEGVDTRGDGGYVVAPPSLHPSGTRYQWIDKRQPVPLPDWIPQALAQPTAPAAAGVSATAANDAWGQRVLDGELARIVVAGEGTRNTVLFEAACKVFEAVKGGHVPEATARGALATAGERAGLSSGEVQQALGSAWARTGGRHPAPTPTPQFPPPVAPEAFGAMTLDQLVNMKPPEWLLRDKLPVGLSVLYGPPGSLKTFCALGWSLTLADQGVPVMYCAGEGVGGLGVRVAAWLKHYPHKRPAAMTLVPTVPALLDRASVSRLHATVQEHAPKLLVIDTLARALAGADENSAQHIGQAVNVIDRLREDHGVNALLIHHSRKVTADARGLVERGSSALRGAADCMWAVRASDDGTVSLFPEKFKDHQPPRPLRGRLVQVGPSAVIEWGAFS